MLVIILNNWNSYHLNFPASRHFEIVKVLIDYGAAIDYCTKEKSTPLRAACCMGHLDIVKYLIKHGANVNFTNISNNTCLMLTSSKGMCSIYLCMDILILL